MILCLPIGFLLGLFFFGGLWWTVQKALASNYPALWFLGSMLLRSAAVLLGFYYAGAGQWQRLALCLVGFALARWAVMRFTQQRKEVAHAHNS